MRQLHVSLQPAIIDFNVNWGTAAVVQSPATPPMVYRGSRMTLYALPQEQPPAPSPVSLTYKLSPEVIAE